MIILGSLYGYLPKICSINFALLLNSSTNLRNFSENFDVVDDVVDDVIGKK